MTLKQAEKHICKRVVLEDTRLNKSNYGYISAVRANEVYVQFDDEANSRVVAVENLTKVKWDGVLWQRYN